MLDRIENYNDIQAVLNFDSKKPFGLEILDLWLDGDKVMANVKSDINLKGMAIAPGMSINLTDGIEYTDINLRVLSPTAKHKDDGVTYL